MTRTELKEYIQNNYGTEPDYPWGKHQNHEVYRHINNKKWFALIMDVPKNKLCLHYDGILDVVNLKCDPILICSLLGENGFFSAYHMNKNSWITVALDNTVDDEKIKFLLDMSFNATASKICKHKPDIKL